MRAETFIGSGALLASSYADCGGIVMKFTKLAMAGVMGAFLFTSVQAAPSLLPSKIAGNSAIELAQDKKEAKKPAKKAAAKKPAKKAAAKKPAAKKTAKAGPGKCGT